MPSQPHRILLADDHDLVRESIGACLSQSGAMVVDVVGTQYAACDAVAVQRYDLILLDYDMPGMEGLKGLSGLLARVPDTPVALLTGSISRALAEAALAAGASGYVPKTLSVRDLQAAVADMIAGEVFYPIDILPEDPTVTIQDMGDAANLSRRERHVLAGICEGKSNKEIARDLDLQEVTVKLYVKTLSRKLQARNRTHAAMIARNLRLV